MLTGFLKYNDDNYSFIFQEDSRELQLIPMVSEPPKPSSVNISLNGVTFGFKRSTMEIPYLTGTINENHHSIIFVTVRGATIRQVNNILYIELLSPCRQSSFQDRASSQYHR